MTNITIRDLEESKELDQKALANIIGGQQLVCPANATYTLQGRTECIGTFMNANNELVQRYRCYYWKIYECYEDREQSFCGPVSNVTPC